MSGADLSEFQDPAHTPYASFDFAIIRVSHGITEDPKWREHVWNLGVAGKPFGLYYILENITASIEAQVAFFRDLIAPFLSGVTYGLWGDFARGDQIDNLLSTSTVDRCRAVVDTGIYVNQSALDAMPEYKRFERIWYAWLSDTPPPGRWLLWQKGQPFGIDQDIAANVGVGVKKGWEAFTWPNL